MAKKAEIEQTEIEAPYELPEGWKWCRLGDIAEKLVDGDHNPPQGVDKKTDYLMLSSRNINNNTIIDLENVRYLTKEIFDVENQRTRLETGDILFTSVGSLGRSCIFQGNYKLCFQRSVSVINTNQNNHFIKLYFDSPFYQNYVLEHATGTAQMGFYLKEMAYSPIPLPPTLTEQQRIVNCIETMFAKLDQAQEKAQAVLDSFETSKVAILHKAFNGELTANWRKANGVSDDSWEEKTIGDCFTHTTGKALKKDNQNGKLHKYITTSNLYWGTFDFSEVREMYFNDDELEKCTAKRGDLLICNGGDVGRAAIWDFDYNICLQNHVSKLYQK